MAPRIDAQVVTRVRIPAAQVWEVMKALQAQLGQCSTRSTRGRVSLGRSRGGWRCGEAPPMSYRCTIEQTSRHEGWTLVGLDLDS